MVARRQDTPWTHDTDHDRGLSYEYDRENRIEGKKNPKLSRDKIILYLADLKVLVR
jgi:hypothetical protein